MVYCGLSFDRLRTNGSGSFDRLRTNGGRYFIEFRNTQHALFIDFPENSSEIHLLAGTIDRSVGIDISSRFQPDDVLKFTRSKGA